MQGRGRGRGRGGGDEETSEDWRLEPSAKTPEGPPAPRAPRWPQFLIKPKQEGPRFVYPGPLGCKPQTSSNSNSKKKKAKMQQTTRKRQQQHKKDWSASPAKRLKQARIDAFYASTKPPNVDALQLDRFPPGGSPSWPPPVAQKPLHPAVLLPRRRLPPLHVQPVPAASRGALALTASPTPLAHAPPDWAYCLPNTRETAKRARLSYLPPLRTVPATGGNSMPSDAGPQPLRTPFVGNCDTKSRPIGSASPSGINGGNEGRGIRAQREEEKHQAWRSLCAAASTNAPVPQPKAQPHERLVPRALPSRPSGPSYDEAAPPQPHSSPQSTEKWEAAAMEAWLQLCTSPTATATAVPQVERKNTTTQLHKIASVGAGHLSATESTFKLGELAGVVPRGKISVVDLERKATIEFPLYAEEEVVSSSFSLAAPPELSEGEEPIDDDAPTTREQFEDGQRRIAKSLQQCMRFLDKINKTQPAILSVERRMAFMRDRLTVSATEKEE